ncbi:MAG: hypothetical protein RDV48_01070 [Candidatus Eremiobacteraeota bacterium]|nr:hypothetical protein [Candidatus Eremiobacteraeota bacterium]
MAPRTHREVTSFLEEKAHEIMTGTAPAYRFLEILPTAEEGIRDLRADFNAAVSVESQEVQEYCRESIGSVHRLLDDYLHAVEDVTSHGVKLTKSLIEEFMEKANTIAESIQSAFLDFRRDALIARGPTGHPGANTVLLFIRDITNGAGAFDELKKTAQTELSLIPKARELIEQGEQTIFTDGLTTFYSNYETILQNIAYHCEAQDAAALAAIEESMAQWGDYYERYDIISHLRFFSQTPTPIPLVNLVIHSGYNWIYHGTGEKEVFLYYLQELRHLYTSVKFRYDEITSRAKPETPEQSENTALIGATLEEIAGAIEGLEKFSETASIDDFYVHDEVLRSAADNFSAAIENLQSIAEESGKITCFYCGHSNVIGEIHCRNCRALLPQVGAELSTFVDYLSDEGVKEKPRDDEPRMTVYVNNLFESAGKLMEGAITAADFEKVLSDMDQRLAIASRRVKQVPRVTPEMAQKLGKKADTIKARLQEASGAYREGVEGFARGMALFREFASALSGDKLTNAKDEIWKGTMKLQKAQHIIRREYQIREQGQGAAAS